MTCSFHWWASAAIPRAEMAVPSGTPSYRSSRRAAVGGGLSALIASGWACVRGAEGPETVGSSTATLVGTTRTRRLMGVPWTITVHAGEATGTERTIGRAFDEIERLERVLSDYDPESELSRLSAAAPGSRPLGDDLWRALEASRRFRDLTAGAFDPTVGPLTALWRQSRRSGRLPDPDKLARARQACGPDALVLDEANRTALLTRPGMRLDLGGIGMGIAADAAMRVLREAGIRSAMIDASGDILVSGPPPGRESWRVRVGRLRTWPAGAGPADDPEDIPCVDLVDAAITTSGDAFQAVDIDGIRYGHVVDPRTGVGVRGPQAVTVIAGDCTTADALATAACVLGPDEGIAIIEPLPGVSAAFQWMEDGRLRQTTSRRWPGVRTGK